MDDVNFISKIRVIIDQFDRFEIQKTWSKRLLKLKGEGMDLKDLCAKHGFDETEICHAKSGRRVLPQERFDDFIAAMKKEELRLGITSGENICQ